MHIAALAIFSNSALQPFSWLHSQCPHFFCLQILLGVGHRSKNILKMKDLRIYAFGLCEQSRSQRKGRLPLAWSLQLLLVRKHDGGLLREEAYAEGGALRLLHVAV